MHKEEKCINYSNTIGLTKIINDKLSKVDKWKEMEIFPFVSNIDKEWYSGYSK